MPTPSSSSSAIAIPKRKKKQHFHRRNDSHDEQPEPRAAESPAASESMMSSSGRSSYASDTSPRSLGKSPASGSATTAPVPVPVSQAQIDRARARRSSFLSESLARSEYTVVDIGSVDNPRLITCVKASQGFDWNQELFLPSYLDHECESLERRQEPVKDIIVTDEEAAAFFPQ